MGNLTGKYDPNAEAQQDLGKLPSGEYVAQIIDSEVKPTANNDGEFAEFVYQVLEGEHKGRKHWQRITLNNPNDKAVEIGNRQMAALRLATSMVNAQDTTDFHFKPHVIRIEFSPAGSEILYGKKKGQKRDRDEAEVKAWKSLTEGTVPTHAPPAAANQAAPATAAPWKRTA